MTNKKEDKSFYTKFYNKRTITRDEIISLMRTFHFPVSEMKLALSIYDKGQTQLLMPYDVFTY